MSIMVSLLSVVLFGVLNQGVSYPLFSTKSYRAIEKEIRAEISTVEPNEKNDHLIGIACQERYDHQRTMHDLKAAQNQTKIERDRAVLAEKGKADVEKKLKGYEIPLNVRSYAGIIEDRFPHLKNVGNISKGIQYLPHNRHRVEKQYKWMAILDEGKKTEDMFVKPVLDKLEATFKGLNPGIQEGSDEWTCKFQKYKLDFCDAISRACDYVNKLFAHVESGQDVEKFRLGVFNSSVDGFMTLFYNALAGMKPKSCVCDDSECLHEKGP